MKRIAFIICTATMLLISCNSGEDKKTDSTAANDTAKKSADVKTTTLPAAPLDSATKSNNWKMFSTPGEVHRMMASWDGTWNTEILTYYDPAKPPMKSTGTSVNKMILGGRYQESINTSNMMGMPFEGRGLLGYNNATKLFESTWIDNMGTAITKFTGGWDAATKSMVMTGKMMNSETLTEMDYKEVFKTIDDKTQTMEMYGPGPDGKEMKVMELKYTKK